MIYNVYGGTLNLAQSINQPFSFLVNQSIHLSNPAIHQSHQSINSSLNQSSNFPVISNFQYQTIQ